MQTASPICGKFMLLSGDTVCNMLLAAIVAEHQSRRQSDSNAITTIVHPSLVIYMHHPLTLSVML